MANVNVKDVKLPFENDGSGGLVTVEGNELVSQRILYGYGTAPGDIVHRPGWGADLESYSNATPTEDTMNRIRNQAGRFLTTIVFLEGFELEVVAEGESSVIQTRARTDEGEFEIPEVSL